VEQPAEQPAEDPAEQPAEDAADDTGVPQMFAGDVKAEADRLVGEGIVGMDGLNRMYDYLERKYQADTGRSTISSRKMRAITQQKMEEAFKYRRAELFRLVAVTNALIPLISDDDDDDDNDYLKQVSRGREVLLSFLERMAMGEAYQEAEDVPAAGGIRATFRRTQVEVAGQSAQELEAAIRDTETRLATRFGYRMAAGGTSASQVLNNATARDLYVRLYALGVTLKDVGNKPPDFMPRYNNMLNLMWGWAGADNRAPWEFEGFFERDLESLPDEFKDAVRTLYQREGYDETSDTPSAEELYAWAETAQMEYEQHKLTVKADAKTVRGYLDVQVLWRAWLARLKASEWTGDDSELTQFKAGPLRTLNRSGDRYGSYHPDYTKVEPLINEAVALGTEQRQVEAVVGREGRATRRRGG
jgi:hypothetical protein